MRNSIKVTFPYIGKYNDLMIEFLQNTGLDVVAPLIPNKRIITKGVEYSPEMMCLPFKITLGSLMNSLDRGANLIIHANTYGWCRFRCYFEMQEKVLKRLGYNFNKIVLTGGILNTIRVLYSLKRLEPNFSIIKAFMEFKGLVKKAYDFDKYYSNGDIAIGVVGEIYTMFTPEASMNYEKVLIDNGAKVDLSLNMTHFAKILKSRVSHLRFLLDRKYKRQAKKYFNEKIAGHGFDSIYNTLKYIDKGYDGIIHALPLTCMPEGSIELIVQLICNEHKTPLLSLKFDESGSETILKTQLETFVEMIRRKKAKEKVH